MQPPAASRPRTSYREHGRGTRGLTAAACALLLLAAASGCSRSRVEYQKVVLDLGREFDRALQGVETRTIDFGTPAARAHLTSGWSPDQRDSRAGEGEDPFYVRSTAWSSSLSFYVVNVEDIEATLDLRALRSVAPEGVELTVALNGHELKRIALKPKRREYRLRLPAARQLRGTNRLAFAYRQLSEERAERRPMLHWYRLKLGKTGPAAPAPRADADSNALFLPYGTEVTYPLRLPEGSVLRALQLRRTGEVAGRLEIRLTSDADGEVEIATLERISEWPELELAPAGGRLALLQLKAVADEPTGPEDGIALRSPQIMAPTAAPWSGRRPSAPPRPNVIVYMIDTLRADRLGCYGYDRPVSPRIDEFAAGATLFENAVGQSSWTRASVASLFTGLWPAAHGAVGRLDRLSGEAVTLAEALRAEGYATGAVVTNHNVHRTFGFDQGFDEFIHTNQPKTPSDVVNAWAEAWLEKRDTAKPFFLYLHTIDPHNPYLPPDRFRRRFAPGTEELVKRIEGNPRAETWDPDAETIAGLNALYDAEIAFNDESFGALAESLTELGLWDDALVIVISDHGEEFFEHGRWSHGKDLHVETLNVPLIVKMPGQKKGRRRPEVVQHLDVMPTVLDVVGVDVSSVVQGSSFLPLLGRRGDDAPSRPDAYSHLRLDGPLQVSLVTPEWKLIQRYARRGGLQNLLYRWRDDRDERHDLAAERPVTTAVLAAMLEEKLRNPGLQLEGGEAVLTPELEQQLRALGYLQ